MRLNEWLITLERAIKELEEFKEKNGKKPAIKHIIQSKGLLVRVNAKNLE